MPIVSRESLAHKLRQNWIAKHPVEAPALDDSLTSLNWLQNLNIMKITAPTPPASPIPLTDSVNKPLRVNPNAVLNMTNILHIKQEPPDTVPCVQEMVNPPMTNDPIDAVDYKTNAFLKPPYSYATLICMAMKENKKNKITLSGIYNWITQNFMYYRVADPSWQNSIRHNLSLNKCFQKVPRRKDEPGKGGFWRINPEYVDLLENGILKKRRTSTRENIDPGPASKRIKVETDTWETAGVSETVTGMKNVNSGSSKSDIVGRNSKLLTVNDILGEGIDFSWNSILNQDIEVGGIKIKTEDIINETELAAESITNLSPPPSSDSSSEVSIEELLNTDFLMTGDEEQVSSPLDLSTGNSLDLTVSGTGIKPPEWWNGSFNAGNRDIAQDRSQTGLHTPIGTSPEHIVECSHPWAEDKSDLDQAMAAFDIDLQNLFEH